MSEIKRIAKRASIVGGGTLISRVLGYVRDAVIASYFGAGLASDAFFVAFRIANLLRRLVGEGALTSSFVPVFTEMLVRRTKEEVNKFLYGFFTLFFFIVVALTAIGILASEKLVLLMSPGFSAIPEKFALAVNLTAMMFPYMI
ncbi:MAG: lipid II flippase MurJ, partial [Deltaproteobacteria bacterium]